MANLKFKRNHSDAIPFLSLETWFHELSTLLFGKKCDFEFDPEPRKFEPNLPWIHFKEGSEHEWAICFSGTCASNNVRDYFTKLVKLSQVLKNKLLIPRFRRASPLYQYCFRVKSNDADARSILFASPDKLQLKENASSTPCCARLSDLMVRIQLFASVSAIGGVTCTIGESVMIKVRGAENNHYARLSRKGMNIEITILEETMNAKIPFTLSLGEVEMSLADALSLRPEMKIEFEKSAPLEGFLQIAGTSLAKVEVNVFEERLEARVVEIIPLFQNKLAEKETFSEISRINSEENERGPAVV